MSKLLSKYSRLHSDTFKNLLFNQDGLIQIKILFFKSVRARMDNNKMTSTQRNMTDDRCF